MPFVPFERTAQVNVRYTYQGQQVENTLYFDRLEGWDTAALEALADSLTSSLNTLVMPFMPTSLTLRELYLIDLSADDAEGVTYTAGLPQAGLIAGDAMPSNVTITASFRTNGRGRSARGRNFLLGIMEDQVSNNLVSLTFTDIWSEFFDVLLGLGASEGFVWVVASRIADGEPRALGQTRPITAYTFVDQTVDSQRRRLPGRGS
jgi:hypothetical protein